MVFFGFAVAFSTLGSVIKAFKCLAVQALQLGTMKEVHGLEEAKGCVASLASFKARLGHKRQEFRHHSRLVSGALGFQDRAANSLGSCQKPMWEGNVFGTCDLADRS